MLNILSVINFPINSQPKHSSVSSHTLAPSLQHGRLSPKDNVVNSRKNSLWNLKLSEYQGFLKKSVKPKFRKLSFMQKQIKLKEQFSYKTKENNHKKQSILLKCKKKHDALKLNYRKRGSQKLGLYDNKQFDYKYQIEDIKERKSNDNIEIQSKMRNSHSKINLFTANKALLNQISQKKEIIINWRKSMSKKQLKNRWSNINANYQDIECVENEDDYINGWKSLQCEQFYDIQLFR